MEDNSDLSQHQKSADSFLSKYKELIRLYHPDHCSDEEKKIQYHEITIKLNALYEQAKKAKVNNSSFA